MVDVSGIPNMGFGGGGYFGGNAALGYPAMSAGQINSSMGFYPNAPQYDPFANTPGGFGAQTAYYQQQAANSYGNINASTLGGYGAGQMSPWERSQMELSQGGGIGSDAARVPNQGDYWNQYQQMMQLPAYSPPPAPTYNAPMSYGWWTNEGAAVPQQSYTPPMGQFAPQTYGWDTNEGGVNNFGGYPQGGSMGSNFLSPGGGFSNYSANPWGGGYDMSALSRAYTSPLQGFDWAQSYGTAGGTNANALRAAGGASSGYYDPQLDWMSQFSGSGQPSANPNYFDYSQYPQGSFSGYGYVQPQGGGMGLTPQDLSSPHAYPPEVRSGWSDFDNQGQKRYIGGT